MHKILYRPLIVISLVLGMLVMIELLALGSITWRNLNRINNIKQDIIQGHDLEQLVVDVLSGPLQVPDKQGDEAGGTFKLHDRMDRFFASQQIEDPSTADLLRQIKDLFRHLEQGNPQGLSQMLEVSQNLLNIQRDNEEKLLNQVYEDSRLELNFAVLIPVVVLLPAFLLGVLFFKRQILSPLNILEQLLIRLTKGEMQPIETGRKIPIIQPLLNSYNRLIRRLTELEEEHISHTRTLEHEVRNATHALLEQSRTLARSERLAAVGELAASAAHELRNPLAGIQAALENMREECRDGEFSERLNLIGNEVKRLTGRLNDLLAYSKQPPETAVPVNVSKLVNELLNLLKYQISENISLEYFLPENLTLTLPESEFRQALLNLLLNSVKELGEGGGRIRLILKPEAETLMVEISDTGSGFPQSIIEQGIRPFVSYHEHGTGLGLSMVQRFARSLGGQLKLNNDSQGHASVRLTLPIRA